MRRAPGFHRASTSSRAPSKLFRPVRRGIRHPREERFGLRRRRLKSAPRKALFFSWQIGLKIAAIDQAISRSSWRDNRASLLCKEGRCTNNYPLDAKDKPERCPDSWNTSTTLPPFATLQSKICTAFTSLVAIFSEKEEVTECRYLKPGAGEAMKLGPLAPGFLPRDATADMGITFDEVFLPC